MVGRPRTLLATLLPGSLWLVAGALGCELSACIKEPAPPPPAAAPRRRPDLAEPPEKPAAPAPEEAAPPDSERLFPGADSAHSPRTRRPTAVLLFAPPGARPEGGGLAAVSRLRFQPVLCALHGKLATGARCGEAMPARVTVRLTESGSALALEELELVRSTEAFRDEQGGHVYPAPYGPACCMYNTCVGRTVPYYPKTAQSDSVLTTDKTILAVWPVDAEIDLTVISPGAAEEVKVSDGPFGRDAGAESAPRLGQTLLLRGRRYAFVADSPAGRGLFADTGRGWQLLLKEPGVREYLLLAGSDVDGDGRPELLVYGRWANDYGLQVLANDAPGPVYGFSCGNI